jgi:sulfur relay (sulfurtransferase) DsrC/TusE family protein
LSRPYHYIIHCHWCDEPVDDNGPDFRQDDDGYLYHTDCWAEMEAEWRAEQYAKHAPDNMEVA